MRSVILLLAAALLTVPASADLVSPQASVNYAGGGAGSLFYPADRIGFSLDVVNDASTAGTITFSFTVTDPDQATVFSQTGNSAPGTALGHAGATLSGIPVSRFYGKAGTYVLTATAQLGSSSASKTVSFQVRDAKITLLQPSNGATGVSAAPLLFQWEAGASLYRLTVSDDALFGSNHVKFTVDGLAGNTYDYRQDPNVDPRKRLVGGILYYWKVEGVDSSGKVVAKPDVPYSFTLSPQSNPLARDLAIAGFSLTPAQAPGYTHVLRVTVGNQGGQNEPMPRVLADRDGTPLTISCGASIIPPGGAADCDGINLKLDPAAGNVYFRAALAANLDDDPADDRAELRFTPAPAPAGACGKSCGPHGHLIEGACVCRCDAGFSGELCAVGGAGPAGLVLSVETLPRDQSFVLNPDAPGAYVPVKASFRNRGSSPVQGPMTVTLRRVSPRPPGTLPSQIFSGSLAGDGSGDVTFNVPFAEPGEGGQIDFLAAVTPADPSLKATWSGAVSLPARRAPTPGVPRRDPKRDLAITQASLGSELVNGMAVADVLVENKGATTETPKARIWDDEDAAVGAAATLRSLAPGETDRARLLIPASSREATFKAALEQAQPDSDPENDYQLVRVPSAFPRSAVCGNGIVEGAEACDFASPTPGCTNCQVDPGYVCSASGCSKSSGSQPCAPASQSGYDVVGCAGFVPSGTVCTAVCANGYRGTVGGTMTCSNGVYTGAFSGCVNAAAEAAAPARACAQAFAQAGYAVSGCAANAPDGTVCSATCDRTAGYEGTAAGTVSCSDGAYASMFTGCSLPSAAELKKMAGDWSIAVTAGEPSAGAEDVTVTVTYKGAVVPEHGSYTVELYQALYDPKTKAYAVTGAPETRGLGVNLVSGLNQRWTEIFKAAPLPKDDGNKPQWRAYLKRGAVTLLEAGADVAYPAAAAGAAEVAKAASSLKLIFATPPAASGPGQAFKTQPEVRLTRADGTVVTAPAANVSLSLKPGAGPAGARLNGTTAAAAAAGVAKFPGLSIDQAGRFVLRAEADGAAAAESPVEVPAPRPDLRPELSNFKVERQADGNFTLKARLTVVNDGPAPAAKYRLSSIVTTTAGTRSKTVGGFPAVAAGSSDRYENFLVVTGLPRDPIKSMDIVKTTIFWLDDKNHPLEDGNKNNDMFAALLRARTAAQALEPAPDLRVEVTNPRIETEADKSRSLIADVKVTNEGPARAARYRFASGLTVTGETRTRLGTLDLSDSPVDPQSSLTLTGRVLVPNLDNDPIKTGGVLTTTVVLLDAAGKQAQDADPSNDKFTLKLVAPPAPPPQRDISVKSVSIGDPQWGIVPITVTVVNNGPKAEPKITVSLVASDNYPASLLKTAEIANLAGNGTTASVKIEMPRLEKDTTVKLHARLSVDPADPVLTHLDSDEQSVTLTAPWYVTGIQVPSTTEYYNTPYSESDPWKKGMVLAAALGGEMKYPVKVSVVYLGLESPKGSYMISLKGLGDAQTGGPIAITTDQRLADQTFKLDLPKTDDLPVNFRAAVVDAAGAEAGMAMEKPDKVPGLKSPYMKFVMPEKHDLKILDFGPGAGERETGDPSDGPVIVHVKIKAAGTVKEDRAGVTFELDGKPLGTVGLPPADANSTFDYTFHLPWAAGKRLKATVDVGESPDDPDSKDVSPDDNTSEIDMPKLDLSVAGIAPAQGPDRKPYFDQTRQKWQVNVTVRNLGDVDMEDVAPPAIGLDTSRVLPDYNKPQFIAHGQPAVWSVFVLPDASNKAVMTAKLPAKDADPGNNVLMTVLQFPPKPPRLDLSVESATPRADKIDSGAMTVPVEVKVKNTGDGDSPPLNVYVAATDGSPSTQKLPTLKPGAATTLTFDFPLKEAPQSARAWIGVGDNSMDADPGNNERAFTAPRSPWDLSIGNVTLGAVDKDKRTIAVKVAVTNAGKTVVKGKQVGVKLAGNEYVSDAASAPEIKPGRSADYVVQVPLPLTGGPATLTALVEGALDGEATPADDVKDVSVTLPDAPKWDLAVAKVVVADGAFRDLSLPAFAVAVTVTNNGVRTEEGPTVSLTRRMIDGGSWNGTAPDKELAPRQKVQRKLAPNDSETLLFWVPNDYEGTAGFLNVVAALADNKDDDAGNDKIVQPTYFQPRDLSIAGFQMGEGLLIVDKGLAGVPVHLSVGRVGGFYSDGSYKVSLKAGSGPEQVKTITDGSTDADFTFDARWGETVSVTAKVIVDRDPDTSNNVQTRTITIPNPPISISDVRVHDNTPGNNCFFVFTTLAPHFSEDGYKLSLEGSGVAKFEGDMTSSLGWGTFGHLYPQGLASMGPWDFTVKVWRDGKVVLEQPVTVPAKPFDPDTTPPPTAANRALIAGRDYKVASITGPTDAEVAALFAQGQRRTVPVKIALAKVSGATFSGNIKVRLQENGTAVGPDVPVAMGDSGKGVAAVDLPLNQAKAARTLTATMMDFEDGNTYDDTLTASLSNIPAKPVFDAAVTAVEPGDFKDGKSTVKVTVTNLGDRTETAIPVRLSLDSTSKEIATQTIASLDPKKSVVLSFQATDPADGRAHSAIATLWNVGDDNQGDNQMSARWKLGWDYKVGTPQMQTEEITGPSVRFTVPISRVRGNYPLDEMALRIDQTDPAKSWAATAKRTPSGDFVGTFDVPLSADQSWSGGVGATLVGYDDDNPADNSAAVNVDLPWAPHSDLYVGPLVMTQKGIIYDVKVPVKSDSEFTEKNIKVGLRMDGHQLEPDQTIASIPKGGGQSLLFHVPAHTAGTYKIEGTIFDHKDYSTDNNVSTVMLTLKADNIPPKPAPPKKLIEATLTPASPRAGGEFKMSCRGLPLPDETKKESYQTELIQKDPSPYQFGYPSYSIKQAGQTKTVTTYVKPFKMPEFGSDDPFEIGLAAIGGAIQGIKDGKSAGDVIGGAAKAGAQTALGDGASKLVGLGDDEEDDSEPKQKVEYGPDEVTFVLDKDTPPGSYVMQFRIQGNDDIACEAAFTIR